ncbi:MAG: bifunctional diguanylate cyclase/phosphodiesterase [Phycisphaerales bacterium]
MPVRIHPMEDKVSPAMVSRVIPAWMRVMSYPGQSHRTTPIAADDSRQRLQCLIDNELIRIVFQPIVDLQTGEISGYEALTRPLPESGFPHPGALFGDAEKHGLVWELEAVARRKAYERAAEARDATLIFMNNSPEVFYAPEFGPWMHQILRDLPNLDPTRIVLEVTERMQEDEGMDEGAAARIAELRNLGFSIAIDDVGAGTNGLNRIMSMRPDWLKLDIELITNIDTDAFKHNMLRFFVSFARMSSIRLVAEGIERDAELTALINLGVSHGQGYYLGMPNRERSQIDCDVSDRIREIAHMADARRFSDPRSVAIGTLATAAPSFEREERLGDIRSRLALLGVSDGLIVLDGHRYLGWIANSDIEYAIAAGLDEQTLGTLPRSEVELVGEDMRLQDVFGLVAARPDDSILTPIILRKTDGSYRTLTLRQLLIDAGSTDWMASRVAPLTGLPNRVVADFWLTNCIRSGDPAHVALLDVRQFEAYNLAFGYDMGDAILRRLVGVLSAELRTADDSEFLAHIGEDRFLLTMRKDPIASLINILERFDEARAEFFAPETLQRGTYTSCDARGNPRELPLTVLQASVLYSPMLVASSPAEIHSLLNQLLLRSLPDHASPVDRIITDQRVPNNVSRKSA